MTQSTQSQYSVRITGGLVPNTFNLHKFLSTEYASHARPNT